MLYVSALVCYVRESILCSLQSHWIWFAFSLPINILTNVSWILIQFLSGAVPEKDAWPREESYAHTHIHTIHLNETMRRTNERTTARQKLSVLVDWMVDVDVVGWLCVSMLLCWLLAVVGAFCFVLFLFLASFIFVDIFSVFSFAHSSSLWIAQLGCWLLLLLLLTVTATSTLLPSNIYWITQHFTKRWIRFAGDLRVFFRFSCHKSRSCVGTNAGAQLENYFVPICSASKRALASVCEQQRKFRFQSKHTHDWNGHNAPEIDMSNLEPMHCVKTEDRRMYVYNLRFHLIWFGMKLGNCIWIMTTQTHQWFRTILTRSSCYKVLTIWSVG